MEYVLDLTSLWHMRIRQKTTLTEAIADRRGLRRTRSLREPVSARRRICRTRYRRTPPLPGRVYGETTIKTDFFLKL